MILYYTNFYKESHVASSKSKIYILSEQLLSSIGVNINSEMFNDIINLP